ncbi:DUF983 domain-containing protein [Roseomonas sp. CCTCC AB2023176]|uniref:DUF983 domain-containing protein n=1 Tax=Roseomonas sp. CCTCC AB2023176 TaxID=3342640 RepID=UPI0035DB0CBB
MLPQPDRAVGEESRPAPSAWTLIGRGIRNRCPNCAEGRVFAGFLRVVDECAVCHAPLGSLRADDAPPYIVIFLVGHLLVPPVFWIERVYEPPMWLHMVVWLPLFAVICTLLLRPVKGGVVGLMWRLGFGERGEQRE